MLSLPPSWLPRAALCGGIALGTMLAWPAASGEPVGAAPPPESVEGVDPLPWALQQAIEQELYDAHPDVDAPASCPVVRALNPNHGLEAIFDCQAFRIEHQVEGEVLTWGLALRAMGRGNALEPVPLAHPIASGNRIESRRGNVTEWFVNEPQGVEQGFTIGKRPAGPEGERLRIELWVIGDLVPITRRRSEFIAFGRTTWGPPVLRYEELTVVDAKGKKLASRMMAVPSEGEERPQLWLSVVDQGAEYPIVIDPWVRAEGALEAEGPGRSG